jgi:phage virion morphogenesis protein
MSGIHIDYTGGESLQRLFNSLSNIDVDNLLYEISEVIHDDLLDRFDNELSPDGASWTPSQRASNTGGKTLTDTSNLRDSFHGHVDAGQLLYGTNEPYAAIHNFGGKAGRNNQVTMPQREIIGFSAKQISLIENTTDRFVMDILK